MAAKENFIQSGWHFLALGAGAVVLVLALVSAIAALGVSEEDGRQAYERRLNAITPAHEGVPETDLQPLKLAFTTAKTPPALAAVDLEKGNFLGSERRILCAPEEGSATKKSCGRPIPAGAEICPFCGVKQPPLVKIETDSDHDGLPDEWEIKYGLNPSNPADAGEDTDRDGFTNLEEFEAGTNPKDPEDHPDYLDSLSVSGPLKQTFLPFFFKEANPIPGGHRVTFRRLGVRNVVGETTQYSVKIGEPIKAEKSDTGYVLKAYNHKTAKRAIAGTVAQKGATALKREVDVSTVEIVRAKDGKKFTLLIGETRTPEEVKADLVYRRGGEKTFTVIIGDVIDLSGRKYRVVDLKNVDKKCSVTLEDVAAKKQKTLMGLE